MPLEKALERLAEGDRSALEEIYAATRRTVYYIALSVLRERMLAEDVMQTTYLKVMGNAGRYRKGSNPAAWIARIAKNEAIDLKRRRAREVSVDERENPLPFGTGNVDDYGLLIDLARRILKEEEFSVLMLAAAEGYKRREIAQMLAMPLPTVTWHYGRAVAKMKRALEESDARARGGEWVNRKQLEQELRMEADRHTPDVYLRICSAQPLSEDGEVLAAARPGRKKYLMLACAFAALLFALACTLPFVLQGAAALSGTLYISINPAAEFIVENDKVTGVRALNRDAALLLAGETFAGMSPEDAGEKFVALSEHKHLVTQEGVGVYGSGEDGAELERRVRDRLSEGNRNYTVHEMEQTEFDALLAAYDEAAMGDFEDYLERELAGLRAGFAERVSALTETYLSDLESCFAGGMTREAFNAKYLYLGEDCIFEDGDEDEDELLEEFEEVRREISRYMENGDARIFDELFDEFLETVEELYEDEAEEDDDDGDDDDDDDRRR